MSGYPKQDDKFEELAPIKPLWQFARLRQFGVQEKDFRTPEEKQGCGFNPKADCKFPKHRSPSMRYKDAKKKRNDARNVRK